MTPGPTPRLLRITSSRVAQHFTWSLLFVAAAKALSTVLEALCFRFVHQMLFTYTDSMILPTSLRAHFWAKLNRPPGAHASHWRWLAVEVVSLNIRN